MSIIRFGCDFCGHPIEVSDELIGESKLCPACEGDLVVPGPPEQGRFAQLQQHKFLLAVVGSLLVCISLLLIYSPQQASGDGSKSRSSVPTSAEMMNRWRDQANGALNDLATNQPGFEKLVRTVMFVNQSDDPNDWTGFADIEYISRRGMDEKTNLLVRFGLVNGLDDSSNVVCFLDGYSMDKRNYLASLEVMRARLHAKTLGDRTEATTAPKWNPDSKQAK